MGKFRSQRNFGYGKNMAWAGKQALQDRYGNGHYQTTMAHAARWKVFAMWCRDVFEIRDVRQIDRSVLETYGQTLSTKINDERMAMTYGHNLLSTANVVLEAMRGDRKVWISPAAALGNRSRVRQTAPAGLDREAVRQCAEHLRASGNERVASIVELAREFGVRFREASMLNAREALKQARSNGKVNITAGTKGGRGDRVNRLVPASESAIACLAGATVAQGEGRNLIQPELSWKQWDPRAHRAWSDARDAFGLEKLHDLRAAYACERYEQITGSKSPIIDGIRYASREQDRKARDIISEELGHARRDVLTSYIGSAR